MLSRLRHIRDSEGRDGPTLEDRMSGIMQSIAGDITECGNACNVYVKENRFSMLAS
jgi:hypothetical protein